MKNSQPSQPNPKPRADAVLRFRIFALTLTLVCAGIVVPLLLVGKEAYVTRSAIRQRVLADSLSMLRRDVERLRMRSEQLSQVARIESIARESLNLDYPLSHQIVIVTPASVQRRDGGSGWEFLAILRRSFTRDKG